MQTTLSSSELKTVLHSKRANLYYLEYCRILVNGGRVEYVTDAGQEMLYWNIPIANTTSILLGTGTSITQAAMREFAKAGVLVGFCGGGGTPLFAANERDCDVSWLTPQSEYRSTEYLQKWVGFWFDAAKRLRVAQYFQRVRVQQIRKNWFAVSNPKQTNFNINTDYLESTLSHFESQIPLCETVQELLTLEASTTKSLYKIAVQATCYDSDFVRIKRGQGVDLANQFLDQGNYLAYGLAATACWVIGLPHGLAILHGKTRRGGLVFDVADLMKDALILPQAFISAMAGDESSDFRTKCVTRFRQSEALDLQIKTLQDAAMLFDEV